MINIVRPTDGWALQRIAESWQLYMADLSTKPDYTADVNIWVNYALFATVGKYKKTKCDIGYFTHYEKDNPLGDVFRRVAMQMDWCIAMSKETARHLPYGKTTVVHATPHAQFRKEKIVLGVCGRTYARKNIGRIPELQKIDGIEILYTDGKIPFKDLPEWYRSIDYLLVLSDLEGGPLPVVEALAMGVPVIAPDVGWCWEYPVIRYYDLNNLTSLLNALVIPKQDTESKQIMDVIKRVRQ